MTSQHDKAKRWRPRFSVRTLVIVVTLVCCYAACWGPTRRMGEDDVWKHVNPGQYASDYFPRDDVRRLKDDVSNYGGMNESAILPLVVGIDYRKINGGSRRYYFWFFGYVAKLPFEPELNVHEDTGEILVWPYDRKTPRRGHRDR